MSVTTLPTADLATTLAFYERHNAALFPVRRGFKEPFGIVQSFKHDCGQDFDQWARWYTEHACNFGVVAFASQWVIIDTDVAKAESRDAAWAARCAKFAEWGLPADARPHVATPGQGWHDYVRLPNDVDASKLVQPDAEAGIVQIRCRGFTIAAGSYYDGRKADGTPKGTAGHYHLIGDHPPHACTPALLAHVTPKHRDTVARPGKYTRESAAEMIRWMAEHDLFADYERWLASGMICRSEYGDDGLALWRLTHDETVTPDCEATKWNSFSPEPKVGGANIGTLMKRAHEAGWKGRLYDVAMFDGAVAQLAAGAGASLPGGMPMLDGQRLVAELGAPIVETFNAATRDAPLYPMTPGYPQLPETMRDHPLFAELQTAIARLCAISEEKGASANVRRALDMVAVLAAVHEPTYSALRAWLRPRVSFTDASFTTAVSRFEIAVAREQRTGAGFICDTRAVPEKDNSDNVAVALRLVDAAVRWNCFQQQREIRFGTDGEWVACADHHLHKIMTDWANSQIRYRPSIEFVRRTLDTMSRDCAVDPLCDMLAELESNWDGMQRLETVLVRACGVADTEYHRAVALNLFGGMVKRAREPGCKHDETVLMIDSTQGTGKSTFCEVLARRPAWYTNGFKLNGTPQNSIPVLFGKWIVELAELAGMSKTEVEAVKDNLSTATDTYTPKYQASQVSVPRRCIFVATSNDRTPLQDTSGARRFLPLQLNGPIDLELLRANIDQVLGEAAALHSRGERFGIPPGLWAVAAEHQEGARHVSGVEELVRSWFADSPRSYIVSADLTVALRMAGQNPNAKIHPFMSALGWRSMSTQAITGKQTRVWLNADPCRTLVCLEPTQRVVGGRVEMRPRLPFIGSPPLLSSPPY